MRIDKFLSSAGTLSRSRTGIAVKKGRICVNGEVVKKANFNVDENADIVTLDGVVISYRKFIYIMLNKPMGYVSATTDKNAPCVTELLDEGLRKFELFPVGRLDKYTTGLMILTNDGMTAHKALSPKHHAEKVYRFTVAKPLEKIEELQSGVHIEGGYLTKPCRVKRLGEKEGEITLTEGKYHQIKQMMHAVGNEILTLERISFAGIPLDIKLSPGEYRELTKDETELLKG